MTPKLALVVLRELFMFLAIAFLAAAFLGCLDAGTHWIAVALALGVAFVCLALRQECARRARWYNYRYFGDQK